MPHRVAFLQKDPLPDPLAMRLAAELTFLGEEADIFLPGAEPTWPAPLRSYAPSLVVIHCFTGMHGWAQGVAREARKATGGAPVVVVGQHAVDHPEVADGVDIQVAVIGPEDGVLPALLWRIAREKPLDGTAGVVVATGKARVEGAPTAGKPPVDCVIEDVEAYRRYPFIQDLGTLSFVTGRGALENCHALWRATHKEVRRRFQSAPRLTGEDALHRLHLHVQRRPKVARVAFRDDTLLLTDDADLLPFLVRYGDEIARPFSFLARPSLLGGERIAALRAAGADQVRLDVVPRTGADRFGQDADVGEIERVCRSLANAGIAVTAVAFAGWPDEGPSELQSTLTLLAQLPLARACVVPFSDLEACPPGRSTRRLARLGPLLSRMPTLVPFGARAADLLPDAAVAALFQAHHDLSFAVAGDIPFTNLVRVATSMRRHGHHLDA